MHNDNRNFFLTLDLEEWFHLEYFQNYSVSKNNIFINRLDDFFLLLKKYNIKITVFVLAELVKQNPDIISRIVDDGHEIACHGLNHKLLYNKKYTQIEEELFEARRILQDISGQSVLGYRAPCFSMGDDKFEILKRIGFKYDSSYIKFDQHKLYNTLKLDGFSKINDLIYKKDGFYEFEIPTLDIMGYNIPISGGGYFRLFPYPLFRQLFKKYKNNNNNFVFYIHPFEVAYQKIKIPDVGLLTKFRFLVGRKSVLKNLEKFIIYLKEEGYVFYTFEEYISKS